MKNDKKKKIKEPYEPNDTPAPPQIIEPNSGRERENPVREDERPDASTRNAERNNTEADKGKQHLLADDAEIDDETTI